MLGDRKATAIQYRAKLRAPALCQRMSALIVAQSLLNQYGTGQDNRYGLR